MRLNARLLVVVMLSLSFLAGFQARASATPIRMIASDARGVTLRLEAAAFTLSPPDAQGRSRILVPGLDEAVVTGRPALPMASALIAIPPGARVVAQVIGEEDERLDPNVRLPIGMNAGFRGDGGPLGTVPFMEAVPPILDGPWPLSPVEVGEPFVVRRQQVVGVRLWPFRYDAATGRLWSRRAITVRLDFRGGTASPSIAGNARDDVFESVLRGSVLNYEQGRNLRMGKGTLGAESASPAFPRASAEVETEVRVQLDTTGVYAIDYDELAAHQFPASVPDSEVSVHRHEYIQDPPAGGPAYATIEIPCEVDDNDGDGRFGSGDRVLVYVQAWSERSRASFAQRAWGDGEVVYVTRVPGRAGLRMATRPGWLNGALTPLASFPYTQHFEKNTGYLPVFQPGVTDTGNTEQFVWVPSGAGGSLIQIYAEPDSFFFETNDIDTTHAARMSVTWRGSKSNGHLSFAHVRNGANRITSVVDSAAWFGRGQFTRTTTLFGSALSEGNHNVLRAWGRTQPCPDPIDCQRMFAVIDWFEANYWRRYNALNQYLACNNAGTVGDYQIDARGFGFPSEIRVYDVTDSIRPARLIVPDTLISSAYPYTIKFQDNSPGGALKKYVVFDNPRRLAPERYATVTRENLAQNPRGDYLLIVPEVFKDAVEPLRALREAQGISVVVATLEAVNDEFNGGRKSSYSIKRFIRYAYRNWDAKYVMLVGDASEDPQRLVISLPDWIPAQKISGPVPISDGASSVNEAIASDPWYVWCLECANPLLDPKLHDLFIGRLPVNSLVQAQAVIGKIVAYESAGLDQSWRKRMLLLADDAYSTQSFFGGGNPGDAFYCYRPYEEVFLDISRVIRDSILVAARLSRTDPYVFDLGDSLADEPSLPGNPSCRDDWAATQRSTRVKVTPKLLQRLNAGVLWWNYQGHANPLVLTHEDLYVNNVGEDDKDRLTNDNMPFLFSAFSCHPNTFTRFEEVTYGPSIGEDLVNLPGRGAVASWGSTGYEIIPFSSTSHINVRFMNALFKHPPADTIHDVIWDGQVRLGEAVAQALLDNYYGNPSFLEREVGISYTLLGDPATVFSIGTSQITVLANGQDVVDGEPVRLVTLADTLRIEADIVSNNRIRGITLERNDRNGVVTIPTSDYTLVPALSDTTLPTAGHWFHLSYFTTLGQGDYRYTIRSVDSNGAATKFDVVFRFFTVLRADGIPVTPGDPVRPDAALDLLVISPRPITDPQAEFTLRINGQVTPFTAVHTANDPSGREWLLTWVHTSYPTGSYAVQLDVGGFVLSTSFTVQSKTAIQNAFAFPNPFDEELGTHFSFTLEGDGAANVLLRVYTVTGKLIYDQTVSDLLPGYHQIAWNGEDAEHDALANGVYLYRLVVHASSGNAVHEGRLVKLRRPIRRAPIDESP